MYRFRGMGGWGRGGGGTKIRATVKLGKQIYHARGGELRRDGSLRGSMLRGMMAWGYGYGIWLWEDGSRTESEVLLRVVEHFGDTVRHHRFDEEVLDPVPVRLDKDRQQLAHVTSRDVVLPPIFQICPETSRYPYRKHFLNS